mmetsp:Transcript_108467/g.317333  ORF Transcript_108467/g.317333 Transcript_108467/m.317333 type:complete len:349 (-) Transcript_108467:44-1090(-)
MEAAGASSSSTHPYLTSKFQVGSAKSDKINFSIAQKVFHVGDVPKDVLDAKRLVQKKKQANILGTEPRSWNQSTIADQRIQRDVNKDLKRQLLKVRAGLMDEYSMKTSKSHSEEQIAEQQKFIVAMTGQGPVGKLSGTWVNPVDERGLAKHCIEEGWPDWSESHSHHTKDDQKDALAVFQKKEERRKRMAPQANKSHLRDLEYINPSQSITNINDRLRERKIDFQDLKEQFKRELKVEFPQASEERLQAMAQRLLNEKLLADEKLARFPVQHENFRPNISLTTQDRRYKEYHHPGTYAWNETEKRFTWSCCLSFGQDSKGCEHKVVNPDAWCTLGYERRVGVAASGKR